MYIDERTTNQQLRMDHFATRKGANKLAKYGSTAIFLPIMIVAPFPTLVEIIDQKNTMMINGAMFDHNVYAFFVIIALVVLYKRKLVKSSILILVMAGSYMTILAMSGFALSERFHMPLVPFYLILAGYGVSVMEKRHIKFYVPYLMIIAIIIIGWNWFKLAGRGMV